MTTEEAIKFARDWRDVAAKSPEKIGTIYPPSAPIGYDILDQLISVIDGTQPLGVKPYNPGPAMAGSCSNKG